MAKYLVTVRFSGSCDYEIELPDDVENVEDALNEMLYENGSFDNITNRLRDRVEEDIINFEKVEE